MASSESTTAVHSAPLSDIRVLDLSVGIAGRYSTRLLAGFGATVTRVEAPVAPSCSEPAARRLMLDADKRSLVLDIGGRAGLDVLHRLVRWADVVVTDEDWEHANSVSVRALHNEHARPTSVLTHISAFGEGPYADWQGTDFVIMALAGWTITQGDPKRAPVWQGGPYLSYVAGAHAAFGSLTALIHAERTGYGQSVEITRFEVAATAMLYDHVGFAYTGRRRHRKGNVFGAPWLAMPVSDGYVALSAIADWDEFWTILLTSEDIPGNPWLAPDEAALRAITDQVHQRVSHLRKREFFELAQALRVLCAEVLDPGEVLTSPQYDARSYFVSPASGSGLRYPGPPSHLSQTPWRMHTPAPAPGQDTDDILAELASGPTTVEV